MNFVEIVAPDFIISDTHLGHQRILEICPWRARQCATVAEHDAQIIREWNAAVRPEQTVLHLGDFAFGDAATITDYCARLNGRKTLVIGNHDRTASAMTRYGFERAFRGVVFTHHGHRHWCAHRLKDMPGVPVHERILVGHCHGLPLPEHVSRMVARDVSIDAVQSFAPFPLTRVDLDPSNVTDSHKVIHVSRLH